MIEVRCPASRRWLLGLVILVTFWAGVLGQAHCQAHEEPAHIVVSAVDGHHREESACAQLDPVAMALQASAGHMVSPPVALPVSPPAVCRPVNAYRQNTGHRTGRRLLVLHGVSRT